MQLLFSFSYNVAVLRQRGLSVKADRCCCRVWYTFRLTPRSTPRRRTCGVTSTARECWAHAPSSSVTAVCTWGTCSLAILPRTTAMCSCRTTLRTPSSITLSVRYIVQSEDCQLLTDIGRRSLRSADVLTWATKRTRTRLGDRSFFVAGPCLWNSACRITWLRYLTCAV